MGSLHEYKTGDLVKRLKSCDDDFSVEAWGTAAVGFRQRRSADWNIIMTEGFSIRSFRLILFCDPDTIALASFSELKYQLCFSYFVKIEWYKSVIKPWRLSL
jgi:hypothetical protein